MPNLLPLTAERLQDRPKAGRILGDEKGVEFILWTVSEIVVVGNSSHHLEIELLGASNLAKELPQTLRADDEDTAGTPGVKQEKVFQQADAQRLEFTHASFDERDGHPGFRLLTAGRKQVKVAALVRVACRVIDIHEAPVNELPQDVIGLAQAHPGMAGKSPLTPGPVSIDGVEDQELFLGQQGLPVKGTMPC